MLRSYTQRCVYVSLALALALSLSLCLYRSEGFLNGIFDLLCAIGWRSDQIGELLARRHRRRRLRHLDIRVDILAGELYLEFSNWNLTHMRALGILIPGFYTEFRAGSI